MKTWERVSRRAVLTIRCTGDSHVNLQAVSGWISVLVRYSLWKILWDCQPDNTGGKCVQKEDTQNGGKKSILPQPNGGHGYQFSPLSINISTFCGTIPVFFYRAKCERRNFVGTSQLNLAVIRPNILVERLLWPAGLLSDCIRNNKIVMKSLFIFFWDSHDIWGNLLCSR